MAFLTGVVKVGYSKKEISAVLGESGQARKHRQELAKVTETVAAYRLKELQYFQAREQLAIWRETHGYDHDDSWMHDTLLLSPQAFTANLWSELNALRDAISMPEGDRFSPRAKSFIKKIGQGTVNSTDAVRQSVANMKNKEFDILKRLVEKRDREAVQPSVTPVSTAQHCIPRLFNPEIPSARGEARPRSGTSNCHASEYSTALYAPLVQSRDSVRCVCQYGREGRG